MATVYLAFKDEPSGRSGPFALKVIREELAQSSDFASMFADEAKVSAGMRHPNVVRVEESGVVDGRLFLAMEVLRGHSVWQIWQACRERGLRLRYDLAAWIFARAADGLHHAHEQRGPDGTSLDLVHRDVNQSNLFVTYDGDVKVIDFGLAKAANRVSQTAAGVVKGKLSYLAPEQVTGSKLDRRADVFALGVALWEVTVDRRLFKGRDDIDTLLRVNECRVPDATAIVDDYPARLWAIVSKCLQKDPSDRYPTAQTLATDLDLFVRECGTGIGRDSVAEIMEVLFAKERERTEEWFRKSEVAEEPLAPLRREQTALLMHNMPSLPPPPKVDLWLGEPPKGFVARAEAALAPSGAHEAAPSGAPAAALAPSGAPAPGAAPTPSVPPERVRASDSGRPSSGPPARGTRRFFLDPLQVGVLVVTGLVLVLLAIFVVRLLRSS